MRGFILGLALTLSATSAWSSEPPYIARGMGTRTCGEFAQEYKRDPKFIELTYFCWAQGFMTGMNIALAADLNKYRSLGQDTDTQMSSIRAYCDKHPLASYQDAVLELFTSFPFVPFKN